MTVHLRLASVIMLVPFAPVTEPQSPRPEPWNRILSLMEEGTTHGNAEPVAFLKSLSPQEMLLGARQACEEVARRSAEMQDMPPPDVATMYVTVCLTYYFDKSSVDEGARKLLDIAADTGESPFLRQALVGRMCGKPKSRFQQTFQTYVDVHRSEAYAMLERILTNQRENGLVRNQAMRSFALQLGKQASEIIESDSNVREVVKEKRKHSDHVVFVNVLVRSGEATLTEETLKALKPIEARIRAYIKLLGTILADEENEPEDLRKQARRRLEGYRKSALTGIDHDVDEALRQGSD